MLSSGGPVAYLSAALPFVLLWLGGAGLFWSVGAGLHWHLGWTLLAIGTHAYGVLLMGLAALRVFGKPRLAVPVAGITYVGSVMWLWVLVLGSAVSYGNWHGPLDGALLLDFGDNAWFYVHEVAGYGAAAAVGLGLLGVLLLGAGLYVPVMAYGQLLRGWGSRSAWPYFVWPAVGLAIAAALASRLDQVTVVDTWGELRASAPLTAFYLTSANRQYVMRRAARVGARERPVFDSLVASVTTDPEAARARPNIVLFTVDCLRPDFLGVYGATTTAMPTVDSLVAAREGFRIQEAFANSNHSEGGLLAIQQSHTYRSPPVRRPDLADYLDALGYENAFFLSGNHHSFGGMDMLLGSTVDHMRQGTDFVDYGTTDDRGLVSATERYLRDWTPARSPTYFNYHLMSAHEAGKRFATYDVGELQRGRASGAAEALRDYWQGVRQADDIIGALLDQLGAAGALTNAIVVITADHGESLPPDGPRGVGHGTGYYPEQFRIPLVMVGPVLAGRDPVAFGSQIDIAPTLIDVLGYPAHPAWQGRSLLRADTATAYAPLESRGYADVRVLVRRDSARALVQLPRDGGEGVEGEGLRRLPDGFSLAPAGRSRPRLTIQHIDTARVRAYYP